MKNYDPTNWYWNVGLDGSRVYSSAAGVYVSTSDPVYLVWAEDGTRPTRIASEQELGEVLAEYSLRPKSAVVLGGYQDSQASKLMPGLVAKVMLSQENRIRALEGKASITATQFRNAIKALG